MNKILLSALLLTCFGSSSAFAAKWCNTALLIDHDCDGYGIGTANGPDADDEDAAVNTTASYIAACDPGTLNAFTALQNCMPTRKGYTPLHYVFVATGGSDGTCAVNNINLPCATFNKAVSLSVAGDAVVVRNGSYTSCTINAKSGVSSSQPWIFMSYPGETVTINQSSTCNQMAMDGLSFWVIDTILFHSNPSGGGLGYGITWVNGIGVQYGTLQNTEVLGYYDGLFWQQGMSNLTIKNSWIHNDLTHIGSEHNIYFGCVDTVGLGHCPSFTIYGNIIGDSPSSGHNLHMNGNFDHGLIDSNQFYGGIGDAMGLQMGFNNNTVQNNYAHTSVSAAIWIINYNQNSNPSITCHNQNFNVFRNNTIIDDGQSWNQALSGTDGTQPVYRVKDECNAADYAPGLTANNIDLGNNTFDSNIFVHWCGFVCGGFVADYNSGGNVTARGAVWLSTDTWRNNVLWNVEAPSNIINVGGVGHDFTYFQANAPGSGNLNVDPLFVAANPSAWQALPNNWNLGTQAGSSARGGCYVPDCTSLDILNVSRGAVKDTGAYQNSASSSPTVTSATPNTGQQGQANESIAIVGSSTSWAQGVTVASFGAGITVNSLTVNSTTTATASITIASGAAAGARNVVMTTNAEVATLVNGFTVTTGTPVLLTVNPNSGTQSQVNESIALTGQYTSWTQGVSVASFGAGITVVSLTVNSTTTATALVNIAPSATIGLRNTTVTTNAEVVSLSNSFTVNAGALPSVISASGNIGRGSTAK